MIIWIDADACPKATREIIYKASRRLSIPVKLVANMPIHTPPDARIQSVVVSQGPDIADDYIAENVEEIDIVITSDIPLAARVVEKKSLALSPRGAIFTEANIRERLSIRDFMHSLREVGVQTGGASSFGSVDQQRFANALDRELTRRLRRVPKPKA